jgi:predicted methyltransferase
MLLMQIKYHAGNAPIIVRIMKYLFSLLIIAMATLCTAAVAQSPDHANHKFSGAEHWAKVFDDPERDKWQKPHDVIAALKLAPNQSVADIGAGTGYFAVRFAHMLPQGRVYGVDVEPDMVKYLGERAKKENLANLTAVAGAPDDARIPAPVDLVILVDVYHHIDQRAEYFRKLRASLKPGGRIAVIDFRLDAPTGPPKNARIAPDRVKTEMKNAGYAIDAEHAFLPNQYFLIFKPAT